MSEYTNVGCYVVLKLGAKWPIGITPPSKGEGRNNGVLTDGRGWQKNCFATPQELIDTVHAMDAGLLDLKSSVEMRALMPKEISKEPVEVIR